MKALFLAEEIPVPADTGAKLRTYNLVREMSNRHSITLVCPSSSADSTEAVESAFDNRVEVRLLPVNRPTGKSGLALAARVARNVLSSYPVIVDVKRCREIAARLISMAETEHFDVFHCDSIYLSNPLLASVPLPSVYDAHNVEAMIWERCLDRETNPVLKAFWRWQLGKMRSYEAKLPKWFDVAVAVSEKDRDEIQTRYGWRNVFVAVNGVDLDYYSPAPDVASDTIIFIGSLDWRPNQDAVSYMILDILPLIRKSYPAARLKVVGRRPSSGMIRLCSANGVELEQDVPDVRGHLYEADISVVPLRIGGGSRLKILESLAAAKPVVSTTVGAEGLSFPGIQPVVTADSPDEFTRAVVRLLADRDERVRLGQAGRQAVEQIYGWKASAANLEQAWEAAAHV